MSSCTFFGHKDLYNINKTVLQNTIKKLILQGVNKFYVGHQGNFDNTVYSVLKELQKVYTHIQASVVLAYIPTHQKIVADMTDTFYPPIEGHPKFAIARRNQWMINASDYCICYINKTWGGAYKFTKSAQQSGLTIINLGTLNKF